jgi:hypothetical protein
MLKDMIWSAWWNWLSLFLIGKSWMSLPVEDTPLPGLRRWLAKWLLRT